MIKCIKKKLSVKIFLITFLLLGVACIGTYICISKLLPGTYSNMINQNTENAAIQLAERLESYSDLSECKDALSDFSKSTNAAFWIEDENGRIIYPADTAAETETADRDTALTYDENMPYIDTVPSGETSTNFYPFTMISGENYTLAVQVDLFVVRQTAEILRTIFPYVILMVFLLSLLCAGLYAGYITRPIARLSKISKQMTELDFSGQCDEGRDDELGTLAHNLNSLSASLSTALKDLQTANRQLRTDIEKEQALERQRTDFFSAASHELKTPLTILKGHLMGMIGKVKGYENHEEYMKRSLAVVDKMETLVKELLYISKTEGIQHSEYKIVDFAELVRVQIAGTADLLSDKDQHLDVNIPDKLLWALDPAQMERAIQNILVNAILYSPDSALIRIALSEENAAVYCEIENTGAHIPEDKIPHLFEAFYRADTSRSRDTGGTGLGLYIVGKIMESHQADYGIKNSGKGVLFWFKLPKRTGDNSI